VKRLVETYDFLLEHIPTSTSSDIRSSDDDDDDDKKNTNNVSYLLEFKKKHEQQQAEMEDVRIEQRAIARKLAEDERQTEEARRIAQEQQALEEEQRRQQQQRDAQEALHRQAAQARQRRLAIERAEQEWYDNIPKGVEGVTLMIVKLKESTKDDPLVQAVALQSLLTIFQQISAHPEEVNFRRIRRNHDQFVQDIGRHDGGVQVLIAAGFTLGAIDEVPCYLSREPDIERDMDGWSNWFDLLKATFKVLEKECE
jgi:hypothetical protein